MRKFKRKVVFLSILAVFFVSIGFYTCYKLFNKPTDKVEQWVSPDSTENTKFISQESIIDKIHETQKLIPLEADLKERILLNDSWGEWEVFKKVKGITFYGKGSYSLDFSNIDKGNIKIDKSQNSISITLPKPIVEDVTIYEEKTVYETTANGLLRFGDIKLSPEQTISISKEVKKLMKDKMVEDKLYSNAETNAKSSIEKLLRPLFPNESTIIDIYFV